MCQKGRYCCRSLVSKRQILLQGILTVSLYCNKKPLEKLYLNCEGKNNHFSFHSQTCSLQRLEESTTWRRLQELMTCQPDSFKHQKKQKKQKKPTKHKPKALCMYKRIVSIMLERGHISWHMANVHNCKVCNSKVLTLQSRMQKKQKNKNKNQKTNMLSKHPDGLLWDTWSEGRRTSHYAIRRVAAHWTDDSRQWAIGKTQLSKISSMCQFRKWDFMTKQDDCWVSWKLTPLPASILLTPSKNLVGSEWSFPQLFWGSGRGRATFSVAVLVKIQSCLLSLNSPAWPHCWWKTSIPSRSQ